MQNSKLRVALIADQLTSACLADECIVINVTPSNYRWKLRIFRPDILLVESAWEGHKSAWKYKIASYPEHMDRDNRQISELVAYARDRHIPTVFWNKEDGVHFERFIQSARLFEHIFTVDENCIPLYKKHASNEATVNTLMFPVQPRMHYFNGFNFHYNEANFAGSYSRHIHSTRRIWQDLMFRACNDAGLRVKVYDRNSGRKSINYRYPDEFRLDVRAAVSQSETAKIYRENLISLNVNTIIDSPTMYSRRLIEIIACGGIAVTNPTPAVERFFRNYCYVVDDYQAAQSLFSRLKHGATRDDLDRAEAGAHYVRENHTWAHRLSQICDVVYR